MSKRKPPFTPHWILEGMVPSTQNNLYSKWRNDNIQTQNPLLKKTSICVICCKKDYHQKRFFGFFSKSCLKEIFNWKQWSRTTLLQCSVFGIAESLRLEENQVSISSWSLTISFCILDKYEYNIISKRNVLIPLYTKWFYLI